MPGQPGGHCAATDQRIGKNILFCNDDFPEYCGGKEASPKALGATPATFHQYVENCDAAIKRAADAGATVRMPASDMFWGDRYGIVVDPFGHQWSFATHIKDMTPAEMQAASKEALDACATASSGLNCT